MESLWSIEDASGALEPRLPPATLRAIVRYEGVRPVGVRLTGKRGRPKHLYRVEDLVALHHKWANSLTNDGRDKYPSSM